MREFYANAVARTGISLVVEALPVLIHISLFLVFEGLAVFLFHVDVKVFALAVNGIGLFLIGYGWITLSPSIFHDSLCYTPLSKLVWFLKARLLFLTFVVLHFFRNIFLYICGKRGDFEWPDDNGIFRGMEEEAEETAKKQSSEILVRILNWTMSALGDNNSQEKFFQTIPGLFSSDEVKDLEKIPQSLLFNFWIALNKFMDNTFNSNSVSEEVKKRRVDIGMDIARMIPCSFFSRLDDFGPKPVSIDQLHLMTRWFDHESPFVACAARVRVAGMLARMNSEARDSPWMELASYVSGISESELRLDLAHAGVNLRLATVIYTCRETFHYPHNKYYRAMSGFIIKFGQFDIRHTLPRLQLDFCRLWNDLVKEARKPDSRSRSSLGILHEIRRHYVSLHKGADAALPDDFGSYVCNPSSIPLCDIPRNHPDSATPIPGDLPITSPHWPHSTPGGSTVSRHDEESVIAGSPSRHHQTAPGIIRNNSQAPAATDLYTIDEYDESPSGAAATALQDISPVAMVTYTLRGTAHSVPAGSPSVSASNLLLPTSYVINLSITAVPPQSHVPPLTDAEYITLPSTTTPSHPAGNTTPPRLRTRGLARGMCLSNAVLQLLVHSPPFWDVLRELEGMKGQLGGDPETATPLVDATVRFFDESMFKEKKPPPTQQPPQQAVREIQGEDEEKMKEHNSMDSFEPTYVYGAMKEKRLLVRSRDREAPFYH